MASKYSSSTPPNYKTNKTAFAQWLTTTLETSYLQACNYLSANPDAIPQIFEDVPYIMPASLVRNLFRALDLHILDNSGVDKALKQKIFNPESLAAYASIFLLVDKSDYGLYKKTPVSKAPKVVAQVVIKAPTPAAQAGASTSAAGKAGTVPALGNAQANSSASTGGGWSIQGTPAGSSASKSFVLPSPPAALATTQANAQPALHATSKKVENVIVLDDYSDEDDQQMPQQNLPTNDSPLQPVSNAVQHAKFAALKLGVPVVLVKKVSTSASLAGSSSASQPKAQPPVKPPTNSPILAANPLAGPSLQNLYAFEENLYATYSNLSPIGLGVPAAILQDPLMSAVGLPSDETMRRGVSFLEKLLFGKNSFYFPRGVNSDICYEAREEVQNLLIAVEDTWDRCTNNQNSQFALSILRVCPDFIPEHHARMAYKYLATGRYNNHNLNDETRDNSVLMHLYQVLQVEVDLKSIKRIFRENTDPLHHIVRDLCMPSDVVSFITQFALKHSDLFVAFDGLTVVHGMLERLSEIVAQAEQIPDLNQRLFMFEIHNTMMQYFPTVGVIFELFERMLLEEFKTPAMFQKAILPRWTIVLSTLIHYERFAPILMNYEKTNKWMVLMKKMLGLQDDDLNCFLRMCKTMPHFVNALLYKKNDFLHAMTYVMTTIKDWSTWPTQEAASETLVMLLNSTQIFEGHERMAALWVYSFTSIESTDERDYFVKWFTGVIQNYSEDLDKYQDIVEALNAKLPPANFLRFGSLQPLVLFYAALKNANEEKPPITTFLSKLLVYLAHYYVNYRLLMEIVASLKMCDQLQSHLYLLNWNSISPPTLDTVSFPNKMMSTLSTILLYDCQVDVDSICNSFRGEHSIKIDLSKVAEEPREVTIYYTTDRYELETSVQFVFFLLVEFALFRCIGKPVPANYTNVPLVLHILLSIAKDLDKRGVTQNCFRICSRVIVNKPIFPHLFQTSMIKNNLKEDKRIEADHSFKFVLRSLDELQTDNDYTYYGWAVTSQKFLNFLDRKTASASGSVSGITMVTPVTRVEWKLLCWNEGDDIRALGILLRLESNNFFSNDVSRLSYWGQSLSELINSCQTRGVVKKHMDKKYDIPQRIANAIAGIDKQPNRNVNAANVKEDLKQTLNHYLSL